MRGRSLSPPTAAPRVSPMPPRRGRSCPATASSSNTKYEDTNMTPDQIIEEITSATKAGVAISVIREAALAAKDAPVGSIAALAIETHNVYGPSAQPE